MKKLDSTIYDKNYYLKVCLGSDEFKKSKGKKINKEVEKLLRLINFGKTDRVLDLGCGRGDISLYIAKYVNEVIGIDYSKDAILLANETKKNFSTAIQLKTKFYRMNAEELQFDKNTFDIIIAIDIFEHLSTHQLDKVMGEIKRVLKPRGILFVHTGTNKILYDFTHKYYTYPLSKLITNFDSIVRQKKYGSIPQDPRTNEEKIQHINEPTYFYLKKLFKKHGFNGQIKSMVGYLKEDTTCKRKLYNFVIALYPISKFFPLNIFFGWAFICTMKNEK